MTTDTRRLFIPVILGTTRKGRASENVARFILNELSLRTDVSTDLIDIRTLPFPSDDAGEAYEKHCIRGASSAPRIGETQA